VKQRHRSLLIRVLGVGVVGLALAGCSPLPGRSLDPIYWKLGTQPGTETSKPTVTPPQGSPSARAMAAGASEWVGRYRDNRGEGDVSFSLMSGETTVSGVWKLRTGGGGPITGTVEGQGQRLQFRMESIVAECPGTFEGSAEIQGTMLVGTYHGKDCQGPVSEGRLELQRR